MTTQPANDIEAAVQRIMSCIGRWQGTDEKITASLLKQALRAELGRVPAQQTGAAEELLTEIRTALNASGVWHLGMNTVDVIKSLIASRSTQQVEVPAQEFRPMSTAPRDATIVRLLVQFDDNSLEDTPDPVQTIGHNNFDHDGQDHWKFAGWCWTQDCYTEGNGTPIGWLPFAGAQQVEVPAEPLITKGWLAERLEAQGNIPDPAPYSQRPCDLPGGCNANNCLSCGEKTPAVEPVAWMHLGQPFLKKQWESDQPLFLASRAEGVKS